MNEKKSIAKNAAVMAAATFFSRIAGLLREQTFAYVFGAGALTDAFNVAFRIPNLLRDLFAEGAMSAAFVPTFNDILQKQGKEKAFRLTNITICAILLIVGVITAAGIFFSPEIVSFFAPKFVENPEKFAVTVTMTRIMSPFLLAVSLAAIVMGILNSSGEFFIPAIAPVFLNLSMIISGWTICPLAAKWGHPAITGMAIGAMIGGAAQFAVQLPALFKLGYRFKWCLDFSDPGLKRIFHLILPGTVGLAATQINVAVSTILATSQVDGAVSWLSYSFRIMQLPLGLFGVAVAQATLPAVSRLAANNDKEGMSSTLCSSIKLSSFINLFACFAMIALAEPIIRIIFQHGKFTPADTLAAATSLRAYSVGLLSFALVKILGPAFYALNETKIPVIASISSVIVSTLLNLILIKPCGYWGLALSTGIGATVNLSILYIIIQKRLGSFEKYNLKTSLFKIGTASALSGAAIYYIYQFFTQHIASNLLGTIVSFSLSAAAGTIVLGLLSWILRIEEASEAFDLFKRRLLKKRRSESK